MTTKHVYFLGIGGTLMGSLALLAKELGWRVSGFDRKLYPPMSDQLADAGIEVHEGFTPDQLRPEPDLVVIGNAQLPRGHDAVEYVLDRGLPYTSGAEWLGDTVLPGRWTIAAAGTHGKTTTASMVAHILDRAGLEPGFLIGGVPGNFRFSSRLGRGVHFVVEADEYDTSYFDRRSKFVHYRPKTLIVNNLELDHADIFDDVAQIQAQFHQLVRTVPSVGLIVAPARDRNVDDMLNRGCWTPVSRFRVDRSEAEGTDSSDASGDLWQAVDVTPDGSAFTVTLNGQFAGTVRWPLMGDHNVANALAAMVAARHAGVPPEESATALGTFEAPKRRMEVIADGPQYRIYDDFAHHPTAIRATLQGLRARVGNDRIVAVVEPGTHTMSLGTLRADLATCCAPADEAIWFQGKNIGWDVRDVTRRSPVPAVVAHDVDRLAERLASVATSQSPGAGKCHIVLMSNGAFGGIYSRLKGRL
ncbi:MAG: UDP-N-acetylmuramate:L-alanyl-gamma-D-glutamyl-meso-diaminopimelate ligase [Gammaproteobacteria bacterium]|nr:UDP-N-acetylmuramate:L-alanyl-gamma-D-glutamyl-meso-diaminopimelate ligase [Gammaproteobacteria bacterium]